VGSLLWELRSETVDKHGNIRYIQKQPYLLHFRPRFRLTEIGRYVPPRSVGSKRLKYTKNAFAAGADFVYSVLVAADVLSRWREVTVLPHIL